MARLVIRHVGDNKFTVLDSGGCFTGNPVEVTSPVGYPVPGYPDSDLMSQLRWYLEDFLDRPLPPDTDHAEVVLATVKQWGTETFNALFHSGKQRDACKEATEHGLKDLHVQISSDEALILGWPWEALHDPEEDFLAHGCQIDRQLVQDIRRPPPISKDLPTDRVNILLVTARPYEHDVGYRSISRPLVEMIEKQKLPAYVRVLRPPTFARLREHLLERPNFYHIVHFDGHGAYFENTAHSAHKYQGPRGHLVFEDDNGGPDPKDADTLRSLLREHQIPVVVLNACQSATIDARADDAFASVATSLIKGGIRGVVAMAYTLYVSGAKEFLPEFYGRLFKTGDLAVATRAGRQQMWERPDRVCLRGRHPLHDWMVPVLYQQEDFDFSFVSGAKHKAPTKTIIPEEGQDTRNPYGFIGRDAAVLEIERAMRRKPPAVLIHGMGGIGKTTLARGFLKWLESTDGLGQGVFWFTFVDIPTAEYVINRMVEELFGTNAMAASMEQKIEALAQALRDHKFLIVWDNFEAVKGIEGTAIKAKLSSKDQQFLVDLLQKLRGGKTNVLITSRSKEDWLGDQNRFVLELGGLQGEEQWEYCNAILDDLGITPDRTDLAIRRLMKALNGHPLSMRVVLAQMGQYSPTQLLDSLKSNLAELKQDDPAQAHLHAILRFAEDSLPTELQPLLYPLSLHERFVDADYLEKMAEIVESSVTRSQIDRFCAALTTAGILQDRGQVIYEIHPAFSGYLRAIDRADEDHRRHWQRGFVKVMAALADDLARKPLHEQRGVAQVHDANFESALQFARYCDAFENGLALLQAQAVCALNERNFDSAEELLRKYVTACEVAHEMEGLACAYHMLGMISQEKRDFVKAEKLYVKSLKIGDPKQAHTTYHQLGMIAQELREFEKARNWYWKSLEIKGYYGDEGGASNSYHQLGIIAQEQHDFEEAEWCHKKSLGIRELQGNQLGVAQSHHQLGILALLRGRPVEAQSRVQKSLEIKERLANEHEMALSYHQLGMIALYQHDFEEAEEWSRKSLEMKERRGDEHGATSTYNQLGLIAGGRRQYIECARWFLRALLVYAKFGNQYKRSIVLTNLMRTHSQASPDEQNQIERMWTEAGLGEFPTEKK